MSAKKDKASPYFRLPIDDVGIDSFEVTGGLGGTVYGDNIAVHIPAAHGHTGEVEYDDWYEKRMSGERGYRPGYNWQLKFEER